MLRTLFTLLLVITAVILGFTRRGEALLGPSRNMVVIAIAVIGILNVYRAVSAWQSQQRGERLKKVPKRPLGI
jgi:hypothetical protein